MTTLLLLLCTTVEIPVSQMWGINIEGASNPEKLVSKQLVGDTHDELAVHAILNWSKQQPTYLISEHLAKRKEFGPGFVVASTDGAALLSAKMILCDGVKPKDTFLTKHELTLVFFTGTFNRFHMYLAKRENNRITLAYDAPKTLFQTMPLPRLALIPLGKLPAGKYEVVIPEHERVCSSFEFEVVKE